MKKKKIWSESKTEKVIQSLILNNQSIPDDAEQHIYQYLSISELFFASVCSLGMNDAVKDFLRNTSSLLFPSCQVGNRHMNITAEPLVFRTRFKKELTSWLHACHIQHRMMTLMSTLSTSLQRIEILDPYMFCDITLESIQGYTSYEKTVIHQVNSLDSRVLLTSEKCILSIIKHNRKTIQQFILHPTLYTPAILIALTSCPLLESFELTSQFNIDDINPMIINLVAKCRNIQRITIMNYNLPANTVRFIVQTHVEKRTKLILRGDLVLSDVSSLGRNTQLQHLELSHHTSNGLNVEWLNMANNQWQLLTHLQSLQITLGLNGIDIRNTKWKMPTSLSTLTLENDCRHHNTPFLPVIAPGLHSLELICMSNQYLSGMLIASPELKKLICLIKHRVPGGDHYIRDAISRGGGSNLRLVNILGAQFGMTTMHELRMQWSKSISCLSIQLHSSSTVDSIILLLDSCRKLILVNLTFVHDDIGIYPAFEDLILNIEDMDNIPDVFERVCVPIRHVTINESMLPRLKCLPPAFNSDLNILFLRIPICSDALFAKFRFPILKELYLGTSTIGQMDLTSVFRQCPTLYKCDLFLTVGTFLDAFPVDIEDTKSEEDSFDLMSKDGKTEEYKKSEEEQEGEKQEDEKTKGKIEESEEKLNYKTSPLLQLTLRSNDVNFYFIIPEFLSWCPQLLKLILVSPELTITSIFGQLRVCATSLNCLQSLVYEGGAFSTSVMPIISFVESVSSLNHMHLVEYTDEIGQNVIKCALKRRIEEDGFLLEYQEAFAPS